MFDVAAARAFYLTVAPHAGFRLRTDRPERAQFAGESGSFSFVAGEPTAPVHVAFGVGAWLDRAMRGGQKRRDARHRHT